MATTLPILGRSRGTPLRAICFAIATPRMAGTSGDDFRDPHRLDPAVGNCNYICVARLTAEIVKMNTAFRLCAGQGGAVSFGMPCEQSCKFARTLRIQLISTPGKRGKI
jgi:hypothetical protein